MKERPVLFSAPMVRAILSGTKTQTRRVVKLPKSLAGGEIYRAWPDLLFGATPGLHVPMPDGTEQRLRNPWGWPEPSRLWVRETWAKNDDDGVILYRADDSQENRDLDFARHESGLSKYNWRPSIFMPRWASRITLEITGVRVERLQEISRGDAMAEGCPFPNMAHGDDPRQWYAGLWEQINGPGSWDANPWVWVIEFKRMAEK